MRSLSRLLTEDRIVWLGGDSKEEVLRRLVDVVVKSQPALDGDRLFRSVRERESLHSTGIGLGLALPHARLAGLREFTAALGVHSKGLRFGSFDGKPVQIFVLVVGPANEEDKYLQVLSRTSKFLRAEREQILKADSASSIHALALNY
jgi:PTS system nitrogen regulatory IIA component